MTGNTNQTHRDAGFEMSTSKQHSFSTIPKRLRLAIAWPHLARSFAQIAPLRLSMSSLFLAWMLTTIGGHVASADIAAENTIENVLLFQRSSGGWPKNYDRHQPLTDELRRRVLSQRAAGDATFDNSATHEELRMLARAIPTTDDERLVPCFLRGLDFTLDAQYENGGWPQRPGQTRDYGRHITFNDDAMIGVLSLLTDIAQQKSDFDFVDEPRRLRCERAVKLGTQCILDCQITVGDEKKAWCAQHDEVTFAPRGARSYELPSVSGYESVGVIRYLMTIKDPSPAVIDAITAAVEWFESAKLEGIRVKRIEDPRLPGGRDRIVVLDESAPPVWARFYDLETNEPIFCSRDGIPRKNLAEISHERRNGYSWIGDYAGRLLTAEYPAWRRSLAQPE